jgi:NAD(P)-dependent dehydrogenase (short-subunit alcohol dehydrogenase family)
MHLKSAVGAASGIGRQIARTYCREGAKVFIADLTQAGAAAAAAELGDVDSAIGTGMDFTDDTQMDAVWQQPSLLLGASTFWSATPALVSRNRPPSWKRWR